MNSFQNALKIYQEQLQQGAILEAYTGLVKFMANLKTSFSKKHGQQFSIANIQHGYLDYTYFYFTDDYLKARKLKCAMVLNHLEMRFEVWLLGRTLDIQRKYWNLLRTTKWNKDRTKMPDYSILEAVVEAQPDFSNQDKLTQQVETQTIQAFDEIIASLNAIEA